MREFTLQTEFKRKTVELLGRETSVMFRYELFHDDMDISTEEELDERTIKELETGSIMYGCIKVTAYLEGTPLSGHDYLGGCFIVESGDMMMHAEEHGMDNEALQMLEEEIAEVREKTNYFFGPEKEVVEGLLVALETIDQLRSLSPAPGPGGDYFINHGKIVKAACEVLGLEYETVSTVDFDEAVKKFRKGA
jgi:hypothetical protein